MGSVNEELFRGVPKPPPSEFVQRYIEGNPNRTWRDNLAFLIDNFPQVQNEQIQYLIEGGTGVKLLRPQRVDPEDIDFITRSEELALQFSSTPGLDAKSVELWFKFRASRLLFTPQNVEKLFNLTQEVEFQGRKIHILKPTVLAMSKDTRKWFNPRQKDMDDINLLGVSDDEIEEVIRKLT